MASFNLLKSQCCDKPYCSFNNLDLGEYLIKEFALVNTKYGERLRLDLGDKEVFMPERFSKNLTPEGLAELNASKAMLIYKGKDAANKDKLKVDFKNVEDFISDLDHDLENNIFTQRYI